jgi:hypothetical protein
VRREDFTSFTPSEDTTMLEIIDDLISEFQKDAAKKQHILLSVVNIATISSILS